MEQLSQQHNTYHLQFEVNPGTFAIVEVPEADWRAQKNAGDVTFCESCEDYFNVALGETQCFRCRGHEYDAEQDFSTVNWIAEPDICIAGTPAIDGQCGDPECVCFTGTAPESPVCWYCETNPPMEGHARCYTCEVERMNAAEARS